MSQESKVIPGRTAHQPLNILFVSHDAHPMGAQNLLLTLASWLKENELANPRFILAGPGALTEEFLRIGPVLSWGKDRQRKATPDITLRLLRSFCGNDLSVVYLNSAASGHVIEMTRHLGVPQIVHVHELEKSIQRWVGTDKMAALRDHAQLFIGASTPVADNLHERHGVSRRKLRVVNEFVKCTGIPDLSDAEKQSCKSSLGLRPDAKIILGCGTTDWRKAPDLFVEVAKEIEGLYDGRFQFVWVGTETERGQVSKLEHMANSSGIGAQVRFVGEVSTPLPFMIASDIFLLPSREDPFPLVCLEAADCGVPIICFADAGGMPDFVDSTCGVVVPYLDVPAMATAISSTLGDETKAQRLGKQAKDKVRSQFDVSVKGQDIYEILQQVCGTPNGSHSKENHV